MAIREHDWIKKYLEFEERSEPPKLYKEWVAMSVIASVLQRKCKLPWGGTLIFYPNLYVVLVGPSGRCRKGTAMGTGKKFLRELGIKLTAEAITREALIKDIEQASNSEISHDGKAIIHSSLTIFSPELAVFLGYENKQLMSDLTDWYDCADKWTYRTKGQGTDEIVGLWVNLLGATTPELIQSQFPESAIGGGLASRIIFVYEDQKSKSIAFPFLEEKHEKTYDWLLNELDSIHMMKGEFKWNETFLEKYGDWYHDQKVNSGLKNERFAGYIERRPNHLLKMCMILSASRRDDMVITGAVFDRALDLLRRTERKMPRTFSGYGKGRLSGVVNKAMGIIANRRNVSRSNLYKELYYDMEGAADLDEVINTLKTIGFCDVTIDGNKNGEMKLKYKREGNPYKDHYS